MREDPFDIDVPAFDRGFQQTLSCVVVNTDTLHPGIDFEMYPGGDPQLLGGLHAQQDLVARGRGGRNGQIVPQEIGHLISQNAAQNQDGRANPLFAQQDPFFQHSDAQVIGS